jgi:spore maturation protein CgeB
LEAAPLKILYVASLGPYDSSLYRKWALERLGHAVIPLDPAPYQPANPLLRKVLFRAQTGPWVARLNRDILQIAERERPHVLWADKVLGLRPSTLETLRQMGVLSVSYMIDNAFGPRQDPGWRLYMRDIPVFDLHVTQRDRNVEDYLQHGARSVLKIQTAYEPTIHFPPPPEWNDRDRTRDVSFIGTPYDNRAQFLTRLWRERGVRLALDGWPPHWLRALSREAAEAMFGGKELHGDAYREAIWRSKINLSFLTHSNCDEFAHKSFEIAACGGFLLAERSEGHLQRFREDEEAVFFSNFEECADKIDRYLDDEEARARIAAAGRTRAVQSGYSNDTQESRILERVRELTAGRVAHD